MNIFKRHVTAGQHKTTEKCNNLSDISNLEELRELTKNLGPQNNILPVYKRDSKAIVEIVLYSNGIVETRYVEALAGITLQMHVHPQEKEVIIIAKGIIEVTMHSGTAIYEVGSIIFINTGVPHEIKIIENSIMIMVFSTVNIERKNGGH